MGLFHFFKSNKEKAKNSGVIVSPLKGQCMDIRKVNDEVFNSGILGDGVAIVPTEGKICAPADGVISVIFPTRHAFTMTTDDGVELLIHFGFETVKLEGEHFTVYVKEGNRVKQGDLVLKADVEAIINKGYDVTTSVLVSNTDSLREVKCIKERKVDIGDEIMMITK